MISVQWGLLMVMAGDRNVEAQYTDSFQGPNAQTNTEVELWK